MNVRVQLTGTSQIDNGNAGHPKRRQPKVRMLTGQDDARDDAASNQCFCEWSELDGFRTCTND